MWSPPKTTKGLAGPLTWHPGLAVRATGVDGDPSFIGQRGAILDEPTDRQRTYGSTLW